MNCQNQERLYLKFSKQGDPWNEYMKENAPKIPSGSGWDVVSEKKIQETPKDPFCIGFDPEEDMSFLPKITIKNKFLYF